MTLDLDRLAELAAKATPGPWCGGSDCDVIHWYPEDSPDAGTFEPVAYEVANEHDANYLRAVSPDVVLALIAEVNRLRDENTELHSQTLDPDATCCADASRKAKELRLAYEAASERLMQERDEAIAELRAARERLFSLEQDAIEMREREE